MLRGLKSHPIAAVVVVGALVAGAVALRPEPPEDLERLERAGDRAGESSEDIAVNLQELADNLDQAAGLTETSGEISELTHRQQRSLEDVAALLRDQLDHLDRSARILEESRSSAAQLLEIGARQRRLVADAVKALHRLESFARRAGAVSADVATSARYGARLAEDSQRSFGRP
ncbi:MAG: hypothetical protein ACRDKZ_04230 [Actinomycetota bacterium]